MATNVSIWRTLVMLLKLPLFAAYCVFTLASGYLRGMARLGESARLLGRALPCPSCGDENPVDGRWKCRSCSATYHGAAFECGYCGAGASFFPCRRCGISISLKRPR